MALLPPAAVDTDNPPPPDMPEASALSTLSSPTQPVLDPDSGHAPPIGLMSDPVGNVATEQEGTEIFPSRAFQGQDWFGLTKQVGRAIGNAQAELGSVDDYGRPISAPEPTIDPDTANKAYGIPGKLKFDSPLPASVAQSMQDAKRDEIAREDAAARTPDGFWPQAARMGAGFVAGALDPLNVAAAFMPAIGEARLGGILARAGFEEGSVVARAATGAAAGVTGQLPLIGLRYGLSQQEQADYSAMDALADVAMGGVLGGVLHPLAGLARDLIGERDPVTERMARSSAGETVVADPETAEAASRTAVSQLIQGNPVEVRPVTESYISASNQAEVLRARISSLQRESDALRAEAEAVPNYLASSENPEAMLKPPVVDEATQARIDAIDEELTHPTETVSAARSEQLMAERRMLTEGAAPGSELEQARSESQRSGLRIAAERVDQQIADMRGQMEALQQIAQGARVPPALDTAGAPDAITEARAKVLEAAGMSPDEARAEALRSQGWGGSANQAKVVGFKTGKGSDYVVHDDGTTTRNKAARNEPGHEGDSGIKARTERTIYVDKDVAPALSAAGLNGLDEHGSRLILRDGKASLLTFNEAAGRWGVSPSSRDIPFSERPEIGKAPVEAWNRTSDIPGHESFSRQHAGNAIIELSHADNSDTGLHFNRAASYAHGAPTPEEEAIARMADTATKDLGPDVPNAAPKETDAHVADAQDALARYDAAGLMTDADRAEVEAANGWLQQAADFTKGLLRAGICLTNGGA